VGKTRRRLLAAGHASADRAEDVSLAEAHLRACIEPRPELRRRSHGERHATWLAALAAPDVHVRVLTALDD